MAGIKRAVFACGIVYLLITHIEYTGYGLLLYWGAVTFTHLEKLAMRIWPDGPGA